MKEEEDVKQKSESIIEKPTFMPIDDSSSRELFKLPQNRALKPMTKIAIDYESSEEEEENNGIN